MASFYSGDRIDAVVVDIGAASTKIGWAGDDFPRSYFRSNVAVRRDAHTRRIADVTYDYYARPICADGTDGDWETCNPIDANSGLLYDAAYYNNSNSNNNNNNSSNNSNDNQKPPDWCDLVATFIQHAYDYSLSGENMADHPVLMAERSYNSPATRQMLVECLFEEGHVPAAFIAKDAVLACYGCGRTSATVVDFGYSGTTVTPVFEGYVDSKTIRRNPGAGLQSTDELILHQLDKLYHKRKKQKNTYTVMPLYQVLHKQHKLRQPSFHRAARLALAQQCRDEGAGATMNTSAGAAVAAVAAATNNTTTTTTTLAPMTTSSPTTTTTNTFHAPSKPFELPDGTTLDVPSVDRFRASDVMFGSDTLSQQLRTARFVDAQTKLQDYIALASSNMNTDMDMDMVEDAKQLAKEAAGIFSGGGRKSRRGPTQATTSNINSNALNATSSSRRRRSGRAWHHATLPHLKTFLEDQLTSAPVSSMVCDAAYRCDRDQQAILLANVIVSGGGACLGPTEQAVPDYVRDSVEAVLHQHTPGWRVKVTTPALTERAVLPWLGGSILGSLGSFHEMYMTKAEYDEWGPSLVNRKCP